MYKKKHIISLSLSLILAMGTITTPIAAADFSDGTTWEESVSAEENQQEEIFADNSVTVIICSQLNLWEELQRFPKIAVILTGI